MLEEQIGACVIVINRENRILLGKRKNAFRAGKYGLPGGRLNKGEKLLECVARELKEETNLHGKEFEFVGVTKEFQVEHNFNFIQFVYTCRVYDGNLTNTEPEKCEGWEWYSINNLPSNLLEGHKWAIDMYVKKDVPIRDIK